MSKELARGMATVADQAAAQADEIDRLTAERDALAAKAVELRDALEALLRWVDDWSETGEQTGFAKVECQCDRALDDETPATTFAARDAKVRAQALRDAESVCVSAIDRAVIRGMADAIEKEAGNG